MYAKTYRELVVYEKARAVSREVFQLTRSFPREEVYSLTDQLRRCSRSIGAQIAEAWAKRRYERHFISKLTDADGEQLETQHWVAEAADCGYLDRVTEHRLVLELEAIGKMLNQMMLKAALFCQEDDRKVHEPSAVYGTASEYFFPSCETGHCSPVTGHSP